MDKPLKEHFEDVGNPIGASFNYISYSEELEKYIHFLETDKITLLESYSNFLTDHGYLDSDWWSEKPSAIDRFLKQPEDNKEKLKDFQEKLIKSQVGLTSLEKDIIENNFWDLVHDDGLIKFNKGKCKVDCNCIEIAESKNGDHPVKNYECLGGDISELSEPFKKKEEPEKEWKQAQVRSDIDCPKCGEHHIDKGEWAKRLHRKHQCEKCNHIWKPYDHYTFGI